MFEHLQEMSTKISIRFFDDCEVRALWDDENARCLFSVLDIVAVLTDQNDYTKTRNYWKYLKAKLSKDGSEMGSNTTHLILLAHDGNNHHSEYVSPSKSGCIWFERTRTMAEGAA